MGIVATRFMWKFVRETKGKTLEEKKQKTSILYHNPSHEYFLVKPLVSNHIPLKSKKQTNYWIVTF